MAGDGYIQYAHFVHYITFTRPMVADTETYAGYEMITPRVYAEASRFFERNGYPMPYLKEFRRRIRKYTTVGPQCITINRERVEEALRSEGYVQNYRVPRPLEHAIRV